jgi:hypothetical protein
MANFVTTFKPTPFGFFDDDLAFQKDADSIVTFVKRKLGDDILSVELTKKQMWACFEEATLEYGTLVNEYQTRSQLSNLFGISTGSNVEGKYAHETLDFILRLAEPYAQEAGVGGSYNTLSGSISLSAGRQDYDMYSELKDGEGNLLFSSSLNNPRTRMKIMEVFHFSPQAAYRFFDTTSAINYLNNEFSFESFTPETVFYVLPVFEDVLRGGQMDLSNRVRRSNYSYTTQGTKIRIYPCPSSNSANSSQKLWIRVGFSADPFNPPYQDDTIYGVSSFANIPYGILKYETFNSMGRTWIYGYTSGLCKELLGLVRSKFSQIPIPGGDLQLNGTDLVSQGREEQANLKEQMNSLLESLTYDKMLEGEATKAGNLQTVLKTVPIPMGKCIIIG